MFRSKNSIPAKLLPLNPMLSTSGSAVIKVFHKNHGMQNANNPVVIISGAATFNGIAAANINGTRTINSSTVTHDTYEFTAGASDTASATGSGGGAAIYATENKQMDVIRTVIQSLTVPGTSIRYYMTPYSETEVASTEGEVLANENVILSSPKSIASDANSTTKTFNLRCVFSTASDNISPVIDMNRASLYTIQNRVIDNTVGDELSATGGNQLARYITKKVDLSEEADVINIYLSANRPAGSNIDVYYKTLAAGSDVDFNSLDWTLINPANIIPTSDDASVYSESKYVAEPSGSFGSMAFKIILRSNNSSRPRR